MTKTSVVKTTTPKKTVAEMLGGTVKKTSTAKRNPLYNRYRTVAKNRQNKRNATARRGASSMSARAKSALKTVVKPFKPRIDPKKKYKFKPNGKGFKVGKPTKYQKRAATKIQSAFKGSRVRKSMNIGLTAAQRRALNPMARNGNIFYNARSRIPLRERLGNFLKQKNRNVRKLAKNVYGASDNIIKKVTVLARKIVAKESVQAMQALSAFMAVAFILKTNPGQLINRLFQFKVPRVGLSLTGSSINWASVNTAIATVSAKDFIAIVRSIRPASALLTAMSTDPITTKLALEILGTPNPFSGGGATIGGTVANIVGVLYLTLWGLAKATDSAELTKASELVKEFFPGVFVEASKALFGRGRATVAGGFSLMGQSLRTV